MLRVVFFVVCMVWLCRGEESSVILKTSDGEFHGSLDAVNGVEMFRGIQYARAKRFQVPQPVRRNAKTVVDARSYGPPCYSVMEKMSSIGVEPDETDATACLSLNIWRPQNMTGPLPVVLFVHGGAFLLGSSKSDITAPNPAQFVRSGNVVFVNFNYRLGPFGFMAHPDFEAANFGLHDQAAAMRWVHHKIHHFGGDTSKITLAGQSAGAISLCFLITAPSLQETFHSVIMQSSLCDFDFGSVEKHGYKQALRAMDAVGCKDADCLKAVDPDVLREALTPRKGTLFGDGVRWFPLISTKFDPLASDSPWRRLKRTQALQDKRIMVGLTKDEGSLFVFAAFPLVMPNDMLRNVLKCTFTTAQLKRIMSYYGGSVAPIIDPPQNTTFAEFTKQFLSDVWRCSTHRLANVLVKKTAALHMYVYDHVPSYQTAWPMTYLGSRHGAEMETLFYSRRPLNEEELRLRSKMRAHWADFVHEKSFADWRHYDDDDASTEPVALSFAGHHEAVIHAERPKALCDMWDSITTPDDGFLIIPGPSVEPRWSVYVNGSLPVYLKHYGRYIFAGVLAFLFTVLACCCAMCCRKRSASAPVPQRTKRAKNKKRKKQ